MPGNTPKKTDRDPCSVELTLDQLEWLARYGVSEETQPAQQDCIDVLLSVALATLTSVPDQPKVARAHSAAALGLIRLADAYGSPSEQAESRLCAARLLRLSGQMPEALLRYHEARERFELLKNTPMVAQATLGVGAMFAELSRTAEALIAYAEAHNFFEQLGDRRNAAIAQVNSGLALTALGRPIEALRMYDEARPVFEEFGDCRSAAACYLNAGSIYRGIGRESAALSMIARARPLFEQAGDAGRAAACFTNAGNLYQDLEYTEEALQMYGEGRDRLSELDDRRRLAMCALNIGVLQRRAGKLEEAGAILKDAFDTFTQLGDRRRAAACRLELAETSAEAGDFGWAFDQCVEAWELLEPTGDIRTQALCRLTQGHALAALGEDDRAAAAALSAIDLLEKARAGLADTEMAASGEVAFSRLPGLAAHSLIRTGRPVEAWEAVQRCKGTLLRGSLKSGDQVGVALSDRERDSLAALQADYAAARRQAATEPGATTADECAMALAKLTAYEATLRAQHPQWRRVNAAPASLEEIAGKLSQTSAALEIVVDSQHVCLFVLRTRDGAPALTALASSIDTRMLESQVNAFCAALEDDSLEEVVIASLGRRLWNALIGPVARQLRGCDNLIVCPAGFLHRLPFGALISPDGAYLIERCAIAYAPSMSAWEACAYIESSRPDERPRPLIVGISDFRDIEPSLPPLASAEREAQEAAAELPGARTLVGRDATASAWMSVAPMASLIHLATHAITVDSAPLMSSLVLYPDDQRPDGRVYARDIYGLALRANLIVLSACCTAQGRASAGEGLLGLSWACMVAGCPATLATRWPLEDSAAREWVRAFYRSLNKGESKAQAARAACLRLMLSGSFAQPHHWAAWALFGSDR